VDKGKNHPIVSACIAAFIISGCAADSATALERGKYSNYRDLLIDLGAYTKFPPEASYDLRRRYAECSSDFVLSGVAPADLPKLDAYARGELDLSQSELIRINDDIVRKLGKPLTDGDLDRLMPFCPADVPSFKLYPPHS